MQCVRADDAAYFGPGGRVRAAVIFPLPSSQHRRALETTGEELDRLYDSYRELIAHPDALEPGSEAASRIANIEQRMSQLETAELEESQRTQAALAERFRVTASSDILPENAGAEFVQRLTKVLADIDTTIDATGDHDNHSTDAASEDD